MPSDNYSSQNAPENTIAKILELRKEVLENPESAEAHCDLGVMMIQNGDPKTAIRYLKQAVQLDNKHQRSLYNLGLCFHKIGFVDNAIAAYENVIHLNPKDDQAWNNLASLLFERGELTQAIECYLKSVSLNPKSQDTWVNLASAQYLNKNYEDAIQSSKKALELDETHHLTWLQLGQSYYSLNDTKNAVDALSKAVEIKTDSDQSWNNLGNAFLQQQNLVKAEEAYRKAIEINDKSTDYWFNLGELLFQQNEFQEAIRCFSIVVEENPDDEEALEYLSKASINTTPLEAASRINTLIQKKGESAKYLELLAKAYHNASRKDLEGKTRLKIASISPLNTDNNFALSQLLLDQGNRDLAMTFLKDSGSLAKQKPELWYRLAQSFQIENNTEDEFQCLTGAVKADPNHKPSWLRLGQLALLNDSNGDSLRYLEKAGPYLENNHQFWASATANFLETGQINLAVQCALKLTNLFLFAPKVWIPLFRQFMQKKQGEKLLESLAGYISTHVKNSQLLQAVVQFLIEIDLKKEAVSLLDKVAESFTADPVVDQAYGVCYLANNNPQAALEKIQKSLDSFPNNYSLLTLLAESQLALKQTAEAEKTVKKALEIRQDHYAGWLIQAIVFREQGRFDQAFDSLDKSQGLYENIARSWLEKGLLLKETNQLFEAENAFDSAVKLRKRYPEAWICLGEIKLENNDYQKAKTCFLKALAGNRNHKKSWQNLSEVYAKLNQPEKAKKCKEAAEQIDAS